MNRHTCDRNISVIAKVLKCLNSLLSEGKGTQIPPVMTASSLTAIFMAVFFCFISPLHAGYTERLEAHCAACHATRWDKEQTNIWAAPSNPDQSVCQGPDKLTVRRGQQEVEGVGCGFGDVRPSTLEGAFPSLSTNGHECQSRSQE